MLEPSPNSASPTTPVHYDETDMIEKIRSMLALVIPDPRGIDIKVRGSVVTLSGQLRDAAQQRAATLITHRVQGVTNVVNKLTLGRDGFVHGALLRPVRRKSATERKSVRRPMLVTPAPDAA